jgi:hypothetical protein
MDIDSVFKIYTHLLKVHVAFGWIGYLLIVAVLASIRTRKIHRMMGKTYWIVTNIVCYTSILSTMMYLGYFRSFKQVRFLGTTEQAIFLMLMSFLSLGILNSGMDYIRYRQGVLKKFKPWTLFPYTLSLILSIYLSVLAFRMGDQVLLMVCAVAFPVFVLLYYIQFFRILRSDVKSELLYWHVQAMLTSTIAYHAPVITGGVARIYFPQIFEYTYPYLYTAPVIMGVLIGSLLYLFRDRFFRPIEPAVSLAGI